MFDQTDKSSLHIPKLIQIQFAQFLHHLAEYSSELTYFAINAFQTSSLRRVHINTLQRFTNFCIPRPCVFYYNLDREFEDFVRKMRLLCGLAKRTFLDIRLARIHFTHGRMMNLPVVRRSIDVFKCNIHRLRDLKEIHQAIGYDLLLPDDQLYLALDLLVTDFELLNCELDSEVKFADAMVLQSITKDIFLQYRLALTWIYPAVKYAAHRPNDPTIGSPIKKCDQLRDAPPSKNLCGRSKKKISRRHDQMINSNATYIEDSESRSSRLTSVQDDFHDFLHQKQQERKGLKHRSNSLVTTGRNSLR